MSAAQQLYERLGFKRTPSRDFDHFDQRVLTYRYPLTAESR
jgi:ribosomal protein S18 acetylase RimI-like enzyme